MCVPHATTRWYRLLFGSLIYLTSSSGVRYHLFSPQLEMKQDLF